jgi:hypothetical protein
MKMKPMFDVIFHSVFWIWNLTFLLVVYVGILPLIGGVLIRATLAGEIPSEFLVTFVALIAVPTICTVVGWMRFENNPYS